MHFNKEVLEDHKRDYRNQVGFESSNLWYPNLISMLENHLNYMDVSKNRGTPKWMALQWKTLLKWMIWG